MITDLFGQSSRDADNITASTARLVNCYRQPVGNRVVIKAVPGMVSFSTLAGVPGRRLGTVNSMLFAVAGGNLYEITSGGSSVNLGAISDDADTFIDGYETNVLIVAGGNYYVYDGTTLSAVTGGALATVRGLAFVGGYAVLTGDDGRFEWATLQDPSTRNALHVATAEALDDGIVQPMELHGDLYLFGSESIEVWQTTGAAGSGAFSRLAGGVVNRGIKARGLAAKFGAGIVFVGDDDIVYLLAGASEQPISTAPVSTAIAAETPTDVHYYEAEGQKFCAVRFASRPSWVYDIATGEWHERAEGNNLTAWQAVTTAKAYGSWFTLGSNGIVAKLDQVNQDFGATMIRRATTNTFEADRKFNVDLIELRGRKGFSELGRDAKVMMKLSRDGGATWTTAKERSFGDTGDFLIKARWRAQGQAEQLTMQFDISEPAELPIFSDMRLEVS